MSGRRRRDARLLEQTPHGPLPRALDDEVRPALHEALLRYLELALVAGKVALADRAHEGLVQRLVARRACEELGRGDDAAHEEERDQIVEDEPVEEGVRQPRFLSA